VLLLAEEGALSLVLSPRFPSSLQRGARPASSPCLPALAAACADYADGAGAPRAA